MNIRSLLCAAALLPLAATAALAAKSGGSDVAAVAGGHGEAILVAQLTVLMLVGRAMSEAAQRIGQPSVVGMLIGGVLLGPSVLGHLWPYAYATLFPSGIAEKSAIEAVAQVGVLLLLLLTGMEIDLSRAKKVGTKAATVAVFGVALPFSCGFLLGEALPPSILPDVAQRTVAALFIGTALSISSLKIVAYVMEEMNFLRRDLGQIIIASAIFEDTAGWLIVSMTLGIATIGTIDVWALVRSVLATVLFLGISLTLGRRAVSWLIRWANDRLAGEFAVVTVVLIVMGIMALTTQAIGVHAILGAFTAGVIVGESPILTGRIAAQLRGLVFALFSPVFFGLAGVSTDLGILAKPELLLLTLGLIGIASIGKFSGAFLGGSIAGLRFRESIALGTAMNARGSMEVIVAAIGLSMGILTHQLFTMIVTMAIVTTMAMPPLLRWVLAKVPLRPEEKARLEREALDAKGYVSKLERILVAADRSRNGRLASRLAGAVAARRGIPVTVVGLGAKPEHKDAPDEEKAPAEALAHEARSGAKHVSQALEEEARPGKVAVSAVSLPAETEPDLSDVADSSYGLLVIGSGRMRTAKGSFTRTVNSLAASVEATTALVFAGHTDEDVLAGRHLAILVPVKGTQAARRGAELALALAPPDRADIHLLHISEQDSGDGGEARRSDPRSPTEKAVIEDVTALAARYGFAEVHTAIRIDVPPERAILEEARRIGADLVVMGASKRVGDGLFLGRSVDAVIRQWNGGLIVIGD